ncbi:MAG TPA: glycosyltransferase family 39 protein [Chloroflexota bacterium]|nr:glycosyltransferase family 39 protein [Chloroflexota bacterium]
MARSGKVSLALTLGVFLALAAQFFLTTPILEGPDSYQHFRFVRYLVLHHRFPFLNGDPYPADAPYQEAAQYPLYYLLGAAVSFPVDTSDFNQVLAVNPHAGDLRANGNGNFLFHRPFSGFPHGTELAARLVALVSMACGLVTVACAWFLGRLLAPKSAWLAAGAGLALAAAPPFVAFSTYVTNDTLVTALSSLTLVLLVCWVATGSPKWSWLSAASLALAILAKFNAVGLVIVYGAAVLLTAKSWRARLGGAAKLALAVALIDGWWMVRNQLVNGDFSSMVAVNGHAYGGGYRPFSHPLSSLAPVLHGLPGVLHGLVSTGAYGVDSPPAIFMVTTTLALVGVTCGVIAGLSSARKHRWLWLVLAWPLVNVAELVAYNWNVTTGGARLLFPAMASFAVLAALGWASLLKWIRAVWLTIPVLGAGLGATAVVPSLVVAPTFAYPPVLTQLPPTATPLHAVFDGSVELVGADSNAPALAQPNTWYRLTLYWRLRQPTERWLDTFVHIDALDPSYGSVASFDGAVGHGNLPPPYWPAAGVIEDRYELRLKPDERPDRRNAVPLSIRVGMYDEHGAQIRADPPEGTDQGVEVARWKLRGKPPDAPQRPLATFPGALDLLSATSKQTGPASLEVNLQWLAPTQPTRNYTVFVQVLSQDDRVLAQHDSYPWDGRYPTTLWLSGERVFDTVKLALTDALPPGSRIVIGAYVLPDARPLLTANGEPFVVVPPG